MLIKKIYWFLRYSLFKRPIPAITFPFRVFPECTVLGSGKAGTTALYYYLQQHPCVMKSAYDELGFYNDNYRLGLNWYRTLFPTIFTKKKILKKHGNFLTYDVTPQYLQTPSVAEKMFNHFPKMKLIVLLRHPTDKSYSKYIANKNANAVEIINGKQASFDQFIDSEISFIENFHKKNPKIDEHYFDNLIPYSTLARAFYARFLAKWFEVYPKNNFLIIHSKDLATDTNNTLQKIFKFLNLPDFQIPDTSKKNTQSYPPMKEKDRKKLNNFFKNYNDELFELLGIKFKWD